MHLWHGDMFLRSGRVTRERCSKLVMQLLKSFFLDPRLLHVAFRLVFFAPPIGCRSETCERRNWKECCVPVDDKGRESVR